MKLMDIDADTLNIPETEYDVRVTMPSSEFSRIVRDLMQLGESVRIEVSKEGVRFASDGEAANGSVLLRQSDGSHITGTTIKPEEAEGEGEGEGSNSVKKEKKDDDVEMEGENNENENEREFIPVEDEAEGEEEQDQDEDEDDGDDEEGGSKKRKKKVGNFEYKIYIFFYSDLFQVKGFCETE